MRIKLNLNIRKEQIELIRRERRFRLIIIMIVTLLFLAGCAYTGATQPTDNEMTASTYEAESQRNEEQLQESEPQEKKFWLITIEQKNNVPFLGSLGDGSIPAENSILFVATNENESPYDGEFSGYAEIESFTDLKEAFNVNTTEYLNMSAKHTSKPFTFTLLPKDIASLTRKDNTDPILVDYSEANFLMPTKGDNPAAVFGSAQGFKFSKNEKLDFSLTCTIVQINDKIELKTDMFGSFTGTIERLKGDVQEIELAPLVPSDSSTD